MYPRIGFGFSFSAKFAAYSLHDYRRSAVIGQQRVIV